MTRLIAILGVALLLAGCGAAGAPSRPDGNDGPELSISGETSIGVVSGGADAGFYNGTDLSITIGL